MNNKFSESMSSLYVTDEEEEVMETQEICRTVSTRNGKRRNSGRSGEESAEESQGRPVTSKKETGVKKRIIDKSETDRVEKILKKKTENEERKRNVEKKNLVVEIEAVKEQQKVIVREEKVIEGEENGIEKRFDFMQKELRKIVGAVEKENGGKISVSREIRQQ